MSVEEDRPADRRRIARVLTLPERMTHHHSRRRTPLHVVGRREHAPEKRAHPERREKVAADIESLRSTRLASRGKVPPCRAPRKHPREHPLFRPDALPERIREVRPVPLERSRAPFARLDDADVCKL